MCVGGVAAVCTDRAAALRRCVQTHTTHHTTTHTQHTQAKLRAFAGALERVTAVAQAVPPPSAAALKAFQFGEGALADATGALLAGASRFQSKMNSVFPGAGLKALG